MTLASPPPKFDPEIIYEFYANVWGERQPAEERRSRVRGIWVPFDPQSINNLLGILSSFVMMICACIKG